MNKVIIQNDIVESVVDSNVKETAQDIFNAVISIDSFNHIGEDIAKSMIVELANESFMTVDLELSDKQKEVLTAATKQLVTKCVRTYVSNIKNDVRTKAIVEIVEEKTKAILERTLYCIGQEVNRGCLINSTAVKADAKNENYNTIELRHSKGSGDITVPTKGVFISTNCIELIKNSIQVDIEND